MRAHCIYPLIICQCLVNFTSESRQSTCTCPVTVQLLGRWPELHGWRATDRHRLPLYPRPGLRSPARKLLQGLPGRPLPPCLRLLRPRRLWTQGAFPGLLPGQQPQLAARCRPARPQVREIAHSCLRCCCCLVAESCPTLLWPRRP